MCVCRLQDPNALRGGVGEKSLRQLLELSRRVADRALPADRDTIRKLASDVSAMTDALCELRQDGKGASPQVLWLVWSAVLWYVCGESAIGSIVGFCVVCAIGCIDEYCGVCVCVLCAISCFVGCCCVCVCVCCVLYFIRTAHAMPTLVS